MLIYGGDVAFDKRRIKESKQIILENNSPALDRKFELTKPKSQLISEAQSAFDEEDEFSK